MPRMTRVSILTLTALFLASFVGLFGNIVIPPAGKTGAPGDGTCAECHIGTPNNPGSVLVDFGSLAYSSGKKQRIRVHIFANNTPVLTGFQLTARLASASLHPEIIPYAGSSGLRLCASRRRLRSSFAIPSIRLRFFKSISVLPP